VAGASVKGVAFAPREPIGRCVTLSAELPAAPLRRLAEDSWFLITVDYAFGHALERDAGHFGEAAAIWPRHGLLARGHRGLHQVQVHGLRGGVSGGLLLGWRDHAGDPALRVHRLRRVRAGVPGRGHRAGQRRPCDWLERNTAFANQWSNITRRGEAPADADEWKDKPGKEACSHPS
jgi:Domain of unknown function (DUF3470)